MTRTFSIIIIWVFFAQMIFSQKNVDSHFTYVDKKGTIRWYDTNEEASFYGVNYTVPFAYSYRAISRKNLNHKDVIDRDVYHFARLGFNAFRLHLWDVEISDSVGNLIDNEHLDLLDYLITKVEERGMNVVLTTMTNFGNGYPEPNADTGGFSYRYEKCQMHSDPRCQDAQRQYVSALLKHKNRYNGRTYGSDPSIVGFEINNEPYHNGAPSTTQAYIEMMISTMRDAGCTRPIFYNASHNSGHTAAYFATSIDGATYQWYPTGLVAGRMRRGNFLPAVDSYSIPFDTIKGFSAKAKIIYEFDPADVSYSYLYPAITRSYRTAGFQWITQFAYDPIDIAESNCEYQTHYLNLAFTPSKAISMLIAANVAGDKNRYTTYLEYPADTIFGYAKVSYKQNLSVYNSPQTFAYSNNNTEEPIQPNKINHIAGVGSSKIVSYNGLGAYFIDKLDNGVWRLEVMPDAIPTDDAYAHPSPDRRVVDIVYSQNTMSILLNDLGANFIYKKISETKENVASNSSFEVEPGVYILWKNVGNSESPRKISTKINISPNEKYGNMMLGEYVAPKPYMVKPRIIHNPQKYMLAKSDLSINCRAVGNVDSIIAMPRWVSMWNSENPTIKLQQSKSSKYDFETILPAKWFYGQSAQYYLVAYSKGVATTYPDVVAGTPIDWDSKATATYNVTMCESNAPIILIASASDDADVETYSLPSYQGIYSNVIDNRPIAQKELNLKFKPSGNKPFRYFVRKYVGDIVSDLKNDVEQCSSIKFVCNDFENLDYINVSVITTSGITYSTKVKVDKSTTDVIANFSDLQQVPTALLPIGYPSFLKNYFSTKTKIQFRPSEIEFIEISTDDIVADVQFDLIGACLIRK